MFFSTKTITVEIGYSKAYQPKVLADLSADIVFAYTYMMCNIIKNDKKSILKQSFSNIDVG